MRRLLDEDGHKRWVSAALLKRVYTLYVLARRLADIGKVAFSRFDFFKAACKVDIQAASESGDAIMSSKVTK